MNEAPHPDPARDEPSRPDAPPAATPRPDAPPAATRRPDAPPAATPRPEAPPAATRRPDAPLAATPRPEAPPAAAGHRGGERPLRLFVALDLPEPARAAVAAVGAAADPSVWRPVAPAALHVTLAFLGSRPHADVAAIAPVVAAEEGGQAPRLALGDVLLLPPRRARVLAVALDDLAGALAALQARVSAGLAAAGVYMPEKRPFRAHITVARLRPRVSPPRSAALTVEALAFAGAAVTLYVSRLHPSGARYEPLAQASLTGR